MGDSDGEHGSTSETPGCGEVDKVGCAGGMAGVLWVRCKGSRAWGEMEKGGGGGGALMLREGLVLGAKKGRGTLFSRRVPRGFIFVFFCSSFSF